MSFLAVPGSLGLASSRVEFRRGSALHNSTIPLFHRQSGLRAVQRLHLAFLIHAQNQGFIGRVEVQPYYIGQLPDKLLIARKFESLDPVRLHTMGVPVALNGGRSDPLRLGHSEYGPVRGRWGLAMQSGVDDRLHLCRADAPFPAPPRSVIQQPLRPCLDKTLSRSGRPIGRPSHKTPLETIHKATQLYEKGCDMAK